MTERRGANIIPLEHFARGSTDHESTRDHSSVAEPGTQRRTETTSAGNPLPEVPEPTTYSPHQIKLIRGTYAAIARLGTQRLSLRAIARELNVSPGLLIYHFDSHENLLLQTMTWALQSTVRRIRRHVREAGAGQHAPIATLEALVDAVFIGPQENRDFYLVYLDLIQYSARHPDFRGLTELARQHINGSYVKIIAAGVESGAFQVDDVEKAARSARSLVEGEIVQWLQDKNWPATHHTLRADCQRSLLRLLAHSEGP